MGLYEDFLRERVEIGAGMVAKVYAWNGFAYKCFRDGHPTEWLAYERAQQDEVCKSGLPIPRYYNSEFPNSIKMDLIEGVPLAERVLRGEKDAGMEDFMLWFERIHAVEGLHLQELSAYLCRGLDEAPVTDEQRADAKRLFDEVDSAADGKSVLCHMDYHLLNVMDSTDGIRIIDWVNAKMGKKIRDYARSYVVFTEHAAGLKRNYMKRVLALEGYTEEFFMKAVHVCAVFRLKEHDNKRVRLLVKTTAPQ